MSKSTIAKTSLLTDSPVDTDAFEGHERIANAIGELIRDNQGGKAIGLRGSWGSGKSTVVEILKKKLASQPGKDSTLVFTFDAWEHQGDPLRRSFLESLIDFLCADGHWIRGKIKEEWTRKRKELSGRSKTIQTTNELPLKLPGIIVGLLAFLVPFGLILFSNTWSRDNISWNLFWIGILLSSLPFLVFLLFYIFDNWGFFGAAIFKKEKAAQKRLLNPLSALISPKSHQEIISESTETPDATSIEFQEFFRGILCDSLNGNSERRLVVVVDNLDRLNPADSLSVWATMRTFFAIPESDSSNDWHDRFWLIVPYDAGAIRNLWGVRAADTTTNGDSLIVNNGLAESFINKTFQVTFDVPPPILSSWKEYFGEQFETAFPEHKDKEERDEISIIFERLEVLTLYASPVTPRRIKVYINKIVSLYMQRGNTIPLRYLAVYAYYRDQIVSPNQITSGEMVDKHVHGLLGDEEEMKEYLMALHYNIERKDVLQVIVRPQLETALINVDQERLESLQAIKGFSHLCVQIIHEKHDIWANGDYNFLASVALSVEYLSNLESSTKNRIWGWLAKGLRLTRIWETQDNNTASGISTILKRMGRKDFESTSNAVLGALSISNTLQDKETGLPNGEDIRNWIDLTVPVIGTVLAIDPQLNFSRFRVPGSAETYLAVIRLLPEIWTDRDSGSKYLPSCDPVEVIHGLVKHCVDNTYDSKHATAVQYLGEMQANWNWEPLIEEVFRRLRVNNTYKSGERRALSQTLITLSEKGHDQRKRRAELFSGGHLTHHLSNVSNENDHQADANVIFLILRNDPNSEPDAHPGQSTEGFARYKKILITPTNYPDIVRGLYSLLREHSVEEEIISSLNKIPNIRNCGAELLRIHLSKDDRYQEISNDFIVQNHALILTNMPEADRKEFIKTKVGNGELKQALEKESFSADLTWLYIDIIEAEKKGQQGIFVEYVMDGMRGLSENEWLKAIKEYSNLITLTMLLVERGFELKLGKRSSDALFDHAKELVGKKSRGLDRASEWEVFLTSLEEMWRTNLMERLCILVIREAGKDLSGIIELYGESMLSGGEFLKDERKLEVAVNVFPEIIESKRESELRWMIKVLDARPNYVSDMDDSARRALIQRVEAELEAEGSDTELGPLLQDIRDRLRADS